MTQNQQTDNDLALTLLKIFTEWKIEPQQKIALLGLPEDTKTRELNQFRIAKTLERSKDFFARAHYLLAIHNAVQSMYPHNTTAANLWITTPSYYFGEKTALEVMINNGVDGMKYVLNHLNGTENWEL